MFYTYIYRFYILHLCTGGFQTHNFELRYSRFEIPPQSLVVLRLWNQKQFEALNHISVRISWVSCIWKVTDLVDKSQINARRIHRKSVVMADVKTVFRPIFFLKIRKFVPKTSNYDSILVILKRNWTGRKSSPDLWIDRKNTKNYGSGNPPQKFIRTHF